MTFEQQPNDPTFESWAPSYVHGVDTESAHQSGATHEEMLKCLEGVDVHDGEYFWADSGEKLSPEHAVILDQRIKQLQQPDHMIAGVSTGEPGGINITITLSNQEAQDAVLSVLAGRRMQEMQQHYMQLSPSLPLHQISTTPADRAPWTDNAKNNWSASSTPDQAVSDDTGSGSADEKVPAEVGGEVISSPPTESESLLDSLPGQHSAVERSSAVSRREREAEKRARKSVRKQHKRFASENERKTNPLVRVALGRAATMFLIGNAVYTAVSYVPFIGNDEHFLPATIISGQVAQGQKNFENLIGSVPIIGDILK